MRRHLAIAITGASFASLFHLACGLTIQGSWNGAAESQAESGSTNTTPPTEAGPGTVSDGDGGDTPATTCTLPDGSGTIGTSCAGSCVDTSRDPLHCGACDTACPATAVCEGACVDIASAMGLRVDLPCLDNPKGKFCNTGAGTKSQSKVVAGTNGKTYSIVLRFRGVLEQKSYSDTTAAEATGTNASFFAKDGTPDDSNGNDYTVDISDPPARYRLNKGASNHDYCDPIDYTATVRARAGATIQLAVGSKDGRSARNNDEKGDAIVIAGVPPAPAAFDGQFVQVDSVSVSPE